MEPTTSPFVSYAAKAVAAVVVPWVIFAANWAAEHLNADLPVEAGAVETAIVSVITGLVVYFKRNAPRQPAEG